MKEIVKEIFSKLDIMAFLVGCTVMGCFVGITWALIKIPIPAENRDSLSILLGIIAGGVGSLVGYYFGSSKGSKQKTDLIDKITDAKP
jgi:hypothetical protein